MDDDVTEMDIFGPIGEWGVSATNVKEILSDVNTSSIIVNVNSPGGDVFDGIAIHNMIFIGDAIFPGGNDYPAKQAGAISICVRDPEETKHVVQVIIACLSESQTTTAERTSCVSFN